jgi:putative salt-induced outer membrane protein
MTILDGYSRQKTRCAAGLLMLLVLGTLSRAAHAQAQAPLQPPAAPPAQPAAPTGPPPKHEGSAEFAFVGTSGNSSTETMGVGGEYIYRPPLWETKFKISYVRNESEDELKAEAFLLSFRAERFIKPRLSGYGRYAYQRDRFAGIVNRNVIEGGLAYMLVERAPHKLVVDGGLGYANEDRAVGEDISTPMFDTGGLYTVKISETSTFSEEGRFEFSLSDGSDWRFLNALALTATITTIFSLKVSNAIRYVNLPVVGFKDTDTVTAIALVAKF